MLIIRFMVAALLKCVISGKSRIISCRFQHCTGHIMTGSWKARGNQYIQLVKVLYCKLLTIGKQLAGFPLEAMPGTEPWPQRWEARVLLLCHRGPLYPMHEAAVLSCNVLMGCGLYYCNCLFKILSKFNIKNYWLYKISYKNNMKE